jgi:hypothetical protein
MAKRKTASRSIVQYRTPKAPNPIIRVNVPQAAHHKKKGGHRRGRGHGNLQKQMTGAAVGGYVIGFIEKQFPTLPTLPVVGKKGAIAIIGYFLASKGGNVGQIARDVAMVAAGLAGYEYGTTGKVSGDVVRQVSGVAAQV